MSLSVSMIGLAEEVRCGNYECLFIESMRTDIPQLTF